mmetsp:Transcript_52235/g.62916  ORF Transcript_52235/g.62916 Transcript_52235/m.62916 type:complete len:294 (+) Transcript_52235:119-1000(+)|eukprot:CAMPEP_0172511718 /NCGR_PEP_ID=MMETSP1066-20121228/238466_1 /TAXON_ID=671091 /ORGANISM="Coscinodiscus wailesii, Strain CCMP2513" /LENGTH=293 /DNA_ID=CAMNT_0013291217 /DNA_START=116 /DNA_END=997 /DNA_ORIENTATION=+
MSNNATYLASIAGISVCSLILMKSLIFRKKEPEQQLTKITDIDDDEADETSYITPEDVIKIFDALFVQMQGVLQQLSAQIQQIQMSGQMIPEPQLRQLLKGEFERALLVKQGQVFDENDVDESCLEEATWEFMDEGDKYPKVKKAVERFQKLYESVSGESIVGVRPGSNRDDEICVSRAAGEAEDAILSKDKLQHIAKIYFSALTETMRAIVGKLKEQGLNLNDPSVAQQLQMQFAMVANDAGEEALKRQGVSQKSFRDSIQAHSNDPEVGRTLAVLQMQQQQELVAMGVSPM